MWLLREERTIACKYEMLSDILLSKVADPHKNNVDADQGKHLNANADS